ncbi:MAG TPA: hypothetical protein VK102_01390 [Sphingobacterium sp.]|nr:hypothetical protein [Sphingobacterium sp.]
MNTRINRGLRAFITLSVILLGAFFIVKAIEKKEVDRKQAPAATTFFYNGPSTNLSSNVMIPDNWDAEQEEDFTCGHTTQIPCSLEVPAEKDIEQYLDDLGDLSAVKAATSTRRSL